MNYLTLEEIKMEFANHLKKYRDYSPAEAAMAVSDFPDPYQNEYLFEDFVGPCVVDGKRYEQYATCTQLFRCGIDIPDFYFYTLYLEEDLKDHTVGEYKKAKKLYIVDEIDPSDFPTMESEGEFEYDLDFPVEIRMDGKEAIYVEPVVGLSEREYDLVEECCRNGEKLRNCEELKELLQRVIMEAQSEAEFEAEFDFTSEELKKAHFEIGISEEVKAECAPEDEED